MAHSQPLGFHLQKALEGFDLRFAIRIRADKGESFVGVVERLFKIDTHDSRFRELLRRCYEAEQNLVSQAKSEQS